MYLPQEIASSEGYIKIIFQSRILTASEILSIELIDYENLRAIFLECKISEDFQRNGHFFYVP